MEVEDDFLGKGIGSIILSVSALEIICDTSIDTLRFSSMSRITDHMLNRLGFKPVHSGIFGESVYYIDICNEKRKDVREVFSSYLAEKII
jgi:hypothetical protein